MLRLWPEPRLLAGVFPDSAWLRRPNGQEVSRFGCSDASGLGLADALEKLLAEQALPRRARVELVVSDQFARVVHLPWQRGLTDESQRTAYAQACFERTGLGVDGDWLIQPSYRHFAADGIAYALPRAVVLQVRDLLLSRGMTLSTILPVSGAAYWRYGSGLHRQRSIVLLEESRRVSAMLFERRKYAGMHVQPSGTMSGDALRRLLNTVNASFSGAQHIQYWTAAATGGRQELIKESMPDATFKALDLGRWH